MNMWQLGVIGNMGEEEAESHLLNKKPLAEYWVSEKKLEYVVVEM